VLAMTCWVDRADLLSRAARTQEQPVGIALFTLLLQQATKPATKDPPRPAQTHGVKVDVPDTTLDHPGAFSLAPS
jgi:hypothetical protein